MIYQWEKHVYLSFFGENMGMDAWCKAYIIKYEMIVQMAKIEQLKWALFKCCAIIPKF